MYFFKFLNQPERKNSPFLNVQIIDHFLFLNARQKKIDFRSNNFFRINISFCVNNASESIHFLGK